MTKLSPTERLEWLIAQPDLATAHDAIKRLLEQYQAFLLTTNRGEQELVEGFKLTSGARAYMREAQSFGDTVYDVLTTLGNGSAFHRLLVV
ncbi:MAG TPA: hypothetical protein VN736_10585 [Candidatus Limnocylindrales bacterium]|nr:hypothetical protein [Candidatus Limnocylindrales bacterium]